MALKIIGIVLILLGIFTIYQARAESQKGFITKCAPEGNLCYEVKKSDPQYAREAAYTVVGSVVMIGFGIVFLCLKTKPESDDE